MDCIVKSNDFNESYMISDKIILNKKTNNLKITINVPSNKLLEIEQNSKETKLSKGAKTGIIIDIIIFVMFCNTFIVLYKTGIIPKKKK